MFTATVPGHDAAFLSLLFQWLRFLKLFKRLTVGSALPGIRVYSMYIGQQATAIIAKLYNLYYSYNLLGQGILDLLRLLLMQSGTEFHYIYVTMHA